MSIFDGFNKKLTEPKAAPNTTNRADFTHPNSDALIAAATQVLALCATGQMLLDFADHAGIKMVVLSNQTEGGYSPNGKVAYINVPAGQEAGNAAIIIQLTGALREAMQEEIDELKRPLLEWPEHDFAQRHVDRDRDRLFYVCSVAYELINEQKMREIFDEMSKIGYINLLEAYGKDQEELKSNASGEEYSD